MLIKGPLSEDTTVINIYAPDVEPNKYIYITNSSRPKRKGEFHPPVSFDGQMIQMAYCCLFPYLNIAS